MNIDVFRSTPVRITTILIIVVFSAIFASGLISWYLINRELLLKLDGRILGEYKVLRGSFSSTDYNDLIESVDVHVKANKDLGRIYGLFAENGIRVAGDMTPATIAVGWATMPSEMLGIEGLGNYRLFSGQVGTYKLVVGSSFTETNSIDRSALISFAWGMAMLAVAIVTFGVVVAVRGQQRLQNISATMTQIGRGDLNVRLVVSQRGDDIDIISSEVNHSIDRLGHLLESVRQVSVDIAHDLKTPLNRLAINLYSAIEAETAGEAHIDQLRSMDREIHRINTTFDALLRIAQIEAGARRSSFGAVKLVLIFTDLLEAYTGVAEEAGQCLRFRVPSELRDVLGDHDLLMQMFANLIENAIHHCPRGAHIVLTAKDQQAGIVVEISDDGVGIPAEEHEAVFRRLYRVERSRTTPGSGLGLSMVKAIADLHGATVTLANNKPGLRVIVKFAPRTLTT